MAETKWKVLELANKISNKKMGSKSGITAEDPRYRILEPVVTDEMAEVGLHLQFRVHQNAEQIAKKCQKSVEETAALLWDLAMAGVCFVNEENGVDVYWHDTWVPGVMEMIANNLPNVQAHPEIGGAFNDYGLQGGPRTVGNFPVGKGLMRVIPIESAIDGSSRKASYEEISKYLNENTIFSVSDCACRTSREAIGEGCGHLKEDMCIQLGHAAEYYIRTGRGKQITREEAYEIIHRAEENGLMHQIPNLDGSGKTHAICNCCGCGCFSLRSANMFINPDMVRSNYVAQVNPEHCVGCGECVDNCPTNALKLGQNLCTITPVLPPIRTETPRDMEWGPDKYNHNYRDNRVETLDMGTSPCKTNCPAHIAIPAYIKLASQGRYQEALKLIKKVNPFPAVCGRICPRLCEQECTRGNLDEAVAIDDVKKFIAEQDLHQEHRYIPEVKHDYHQKIAIIGGGPAGLTAAYFLAIEGYKVTVFEKNKNLGGMLTYGIPGFRLQKDVIQAEIDILKSIGVDFQTGVTVGKDITIPQLRSQGYKAFFVAIGAQNGRRLGLVNEDAEGIQTGVDFLRRVHDEPSMSLKGKVVVIGGGNVAIDVARSATRVQADQVSMFCLESRDTMPALEEEIEEALFEHIEIQNSWGPKEFVVENNKVRGVVFRKCIQVFDESKRFNPKYDENDTIFVEADHVLIAVGQSFDYGTLLEGTQVEFQRNGTMKVDSFTLQSKEPDIFAGGDIVSGPKFAIDAIALGKEGAISIHRFVNKGISLTYGRSRHVYKALDKQNVKYESYDHIPRERATVHHTKLQDHGFVESAGVLTEEQVRKETARCLQCGVTVVDEFMCVGCGQCTTKCKFDAIQLVKKYDAEGVSFEHLKPHVLKQMIKRKFKIAMRKAKEHFHFKKG